MTAVFKILKRLSEQEDLKQWSVWCSISDMISTFYSALHVFSTCFLYTRCGSFCVVCIFPSLVSFSYLISPDLPSFLLPRRLCCAVLITALSLPFPPHSFLRWHRSVLLSLPPSTWLFSSQGKCVWTSLESCVLSVSFYV